MKKEQNKTTGLEVIIKTYKEIFSIPENLNHYSEEDYKKAEKKFLKYALTEGWSLPYRISES